MIREPLRVTFVLPTASQRPSGGYGVVVDYANGLAERGHSCKLVIPAVVRYGYGPARLTARQTLEHVRSALAPRGRLPWATLADSVQVVVRPNLSSPFLPAADVTVATAWQTATSVFHSSRRSGQPVYFIQHYEDWSASDAALVDATWRLPMPKALIAQWLMRRADALGEGERATYMPNGIDLDRFRVIVPPSRRRPLTVGMLVHDVEWKGTRVGLDALARLRERIPGLEVSLFGAVRPQFELPGWATFHENLTAEEVTEFLNSVAIFVHPSISEGWGLPALEAMACGAALVTADNDGVKDFAAPDKTAVVIPAGSVEALADAASSLLADTPRRLALAEAAVQAAGQFSRPRAIDRFERFLRSASDPDHSA